MKSCSAPPARFLKAISQLQTPFWQGVEQMDQNKFSEDHGPAARQNQPDLFVFHQRLPLFSDAGHRGGLLHPGDDLALVEITH
jgi:hypothetical protein